MATKDKQGRAYAKLSDVKPGDVLIADGDFSCLSDQQRCVVYQFDDKLFVLCADGGHGLAGQDDGDGYLVGFYHKPRP